MIRDRVKDLIIIAGENVYPAEVEKQSFASLRARQRGGWRARRTAWGADTGVWWPSRDSPSSLKTDRFRSRGSPDSRCLRTTSSSIRSRGIRAARYCDESCANGSGSDGTGNKASRDAKGSLFPRPSSQPPPAMRWRSVRRARQDSVDQALSSSKCAIDSAVGAHWQFRRDQHRPAQQRHVVRRPSEVASSSWVASQLTSWRWLATTLNQNTSPCRPDSASHCGPSISRSMALGARRRCRRPASP